MTPPDEPDAGGGGAGAPPPENAANRVRAGLTREYTRPEISIQWYASRCIHSGKCILALPAVFDPSRRPWIDIAAADPDALADAVVKCPTGALRFARHDGGEQERAPDDVQIIPVRNEPSPIDPAVRRGRRVPSGTKKTLWRVDLP